MRRRKKKIGDALRGKTTKLKGRKIYRPSRPKGMWRKNWEIIKKELY